MKSPVDCGRQHPQPYCTCEACRHDSLLDKIVDKVLSHKPKPKSKPARKRARRAKKIAQAADV